jgi:hypothetical protein
MASHPIYDPHYEGIMKFVMTTVLASICICGIFGKN